MIYFTELQNLPVYDVKGGYLGRLNDLVVDPSHNSVRVASYLVRAPDGQTLCIRHDQMQSISVRAGQTTVSRSEIQCYAPDESLLHLRKDVLDQQVIDVNHRKVVRVNDIDLEIKPTDGHTDLRILAVNVGVAAGVRRLLQGLTAKHTLRAISGLFSSATIRWEFVNLIEADPARRLRLKLSSDRLKLLHPADLADILEQLSRDEQRAVIDTLDDETAAQVISEIPTHLQASLLEGIARPKAAGIVEEMAPDEAADLLQELSPETSAELLAGMETEEARDVKELLGFEENTAGALMTTEYIVIGENATVAGVIETLKHYDGPIEQIHEIYLVNSEAVLTGAVPLARILLAGGEEPIQQLASESLISSPAHADEKTVVDLFNKYNLLTLPVVDDKQHLVGVITADDVLEILVKR